MTYERRYRYRDGAIESGPFRAGSPETKIAEITHVIKTGYILVDACVREAGGTYLCRARCGQHVRNEAATACDCTVAATRMTPRARLHGQRNLLPHNVLSVSGLEDYHRLAMDEF